MFQMIYVSSATRLLTSSELGLMLEKFREKNAQKNITGLLLYRDGNFIQVLEGEEADIKDLFAKIFQDSRHRDVNVISEDSIEAREFGDWSMGFYEVQKSDREGFNDFLTHPFTPDQMAHSVAYTMLQIFRGKMR